MWISTLICWLFQSRTDFIYSYDMIYDNKNDTSNEVTKNIMWQKNLWEVEIFYDSMHLQSYSELVSVTCAKDAMTMSIIISLILMSIMKKNIHYSTPHLSIQERNQFLYHLVVLDMCTLTLLTHSHFQFQVLGTKSDKHMQRGRAWRIGILSFSKGDAKKYGSGSVDFILAGSFTLATHGKVNDITQYNTTTYQLLCLHMACMNEINVDCHFFFSRV